MFLMHLCTKKLNLFDQFLYIDEYILVYVHLLAHGKITLGIIELIRCKHTCSPLYFLMYCITYIFIHFDVHSRCLVILSNIENKIKETLLCILLEKSLKSFTFAIHHDNIVKHLHNRDLCAGLFKDMKTNKQQK